MRHLLTLVLLLLILPLSAQTEAEKEKALDLGRQAIKLMDEGKIPESIALLEEAKSIDSDNPAYDYEIGYAYYLGKNYNMAAKVLKKASKKANASKEMFSMLGNAYDNLGDSKKAIKAYEKGIEKFPDVAIFHVELGILEYRRNDLTRAAAHWEAGIRTDPNYPSNYFHLANLFALTKEHIWTVLYGEMFLNLEPGTSRTEVISETVYNGYQRAIELKGDSARVSFVKSMTLSMTDLTDFKLPAPMVFGTSMTVGTIAVTGETDLNSTSLHKIRKGFLEFWDKNGHFDIYPNTVIDRMKAIQEAGHLETYNHWLLSAGDPVGWEFWADSHKEEFNAFIEWFNANGMQVEKGKEMTRGSF